MSRREGDFRTGWTSAHARRRVWTLGHLVPGERGLGPRAFARGGTVRGNALPRSRRGPTGVQNQQCRAAARFAAAICFAIPPGYLVGETGFEPATPWSRTGLGELRRGGS